MTERGIGIRKRKTVFISRKRIPKERCTVISAPDAFDDFDSYPKITNYVAKVSLNTRFNLNYLALYIYSTHRAPNKFAAMSIKISNTTCLLFSTGNMVVTGAKTEKGARHAAHMYRLFLEKIKQYVRNENKGINGDDRDYVLSTLEEYTSFDNFEIVNIVAKGNLFENTTINLGELSKNNIDLTGWDAETFPGLRFSIYRSPECPISVETLMAHVFRRSNNVIMKARTKMDIYYGHRALKNMVSPYAVSDSVSSAEEGRTKTKDDAERKKEVKKNGSRKRKRKTLEEGIFPGVSLSDLGLDEQSLLDASFPKNERNSATRIVDKGKHREENPPLAEKRITVVRRGTVARASIDEDDSVSENQDGPVAVVDEKDKWNEILNGLFDFLNDDLIYGNSRNTSESKSNRDSLASLDFATQTLTNKKES